MPSISHGDVIRVEALSTPAENPHVPNADLTSNIDCLHRTRFGYLFRELQKDAENLLPQCPPTIAALVNLGSAMGDAGSDPAFDSAIPSAYTYFAQFVSHDITHDAVTLDVDLSKSQIEPWPLDDILQKLVNSRRPTLDLDSVYEPAYYKGECYSVPRKSGNDNEMMIGPALRGNDFIPDHDLPRWLEKENPDPNFDRTAKVGDGRNDENLILSQLHVAFLRAHNAIVAKGSSFDEARKLLRQHYQWIVVGDFLNRVADPDIVKVIRSGAVKVYSPPEGDDFFMPLEFTVAAFRFGHSLVRSVYDYNDEHKQATLLNLFMSNALGYSFQLPSSWIIRWDRFLEGGPNVARRIDTRLAEPLGILLDPKGNLLQFEHRLAVRDLLRGYILRIPTGQAVARALHMPVMSEAEIEKVAGEVSAEQKQVLHYSGFSSRTPLWFYILAEAAHSGTGRLGPVGSILVASVMVELVRRSKDSILNDPAWSPTLGQTKGQFDLPDLFHLAGVLN
ncbi:MAG TPA: peroxidase family protein [Pyrinomonadaceae bacterium]|jgi:hypothetical protein